MEDKIVTIDGTEIVVSYDGDTPTADVVESFEQYLRENVFVHGEYVYHTNHSYVCVAEYEDEHCYIIPEDIDNLLEDDNTELHAVEHGKLVIQDRR